MALSILLVDDSKMARMMLTKELRNLFKDSPFILTEAANGNEALEHMQASPFDLVFLDLTMPEKTGYEVLETLKEKNITSNIIVLTADIQPEAEKIVKNLGAIGYIKKERPLNINPLIEILREMGVL